MYDELPAAAGRAVRRGRGRRARRDDDRSRGGDARRPGGEGGLPRHPGAGDDDLRRDAARLLHDHGRRASRPPPRGSLEAGADAVGSNCGNGIEQMVQVAREFRRHTAAPLVIQSNAGLPAQRGRPQSCTTRRRRSSRTGRASCRAGRVRHRRLLRHDSGPHRRPARDGGQPVTASGAASATRDDVPRAGPGSPGLFRGGSRRPSVGGVRDERQPPGAHVSALDAHQPPAGDSPGRRSWARTLSTCHRAESAGRV